MGIVVCVELSEKSKNDLDELLALGRYPDYSAAVSVAISNQLLLQKRAAQSRAFVLSDNGQSMPTQQNLTPQPPRLPTSIPPLFTLAAAQNCKIEPVALPDSHEERGSKITVDRWFFGQHNKLLPVKSTCRALATLLAERPFGIPLSEAAPKIAKEAANLGDYLQQLDARSGAVREEALATAFPRNADDSDRSRLRYANQFIGALNTQDHLSGLLVDLRLVNIVAAKQHHLLLTAPGIEFAKLVNPVFDEPIGATDRPPKRFSDEEVEFLARHIRENVPVEDFAFRTVLGAIKNGINTPKLLDERLARLLVPGKNKVSEAFVSTQRAGVISRMSDLEMIIRRREGIHVKYEATVRGSAFIQ